MTREGTARLDFGLKSDNRPFIEQRDVRGQLRSVLGMTSDDLPLLELHDSQDRPKLLAFMKPDDTPKLVLLNNNRNGGFAAGLTALGLPGLLFGDTSGNHKLVVGLKDDGAPNVTMNDPRMRPRSRRPLIPRRAMAASPCSMGMANRSRAARLSKYASGNFARAVRFRNEPTVLMWIAKSVI